MTVFLRDNLHRRSQLRKSHHSYLSLTLRVRRTAALPRLWLGTVDVSF